MNGFINCYKPKGVTSTHVVACVKRQFREDKVGHMGTLDPEAEGVLPIAIGRATRLFDYLTDKKKLYRAVFTFGKTTDTLDATGKVIGEGGRVPTVEEIKGIIPQFLGEISQLPPQFSALSVNGVRAYDLARKGLEADLKPRNVTIYSINLLGCKGDGFELDIECGGGTYIRALARDFAAKLGTLGYMESLIRLRSGVFVAEDSHSLESICENAADKVLPIEFPLSSLKRHNVQPDYYKSALNGLFVPLRLPRGVLVRVYVDGEFVGIAASDKGRLTYKYWLRG